jgi:peptidoglycan/LPS O-acetylase OafA/YrhL
MKTQNIPALTGLRFFAAMAIVLTHSQIGNFFKPGAFAPVYLAGAVPVFFVLSGFVLTLGFDKQRPWADFFIARVARIWPTHLAAIVFLFAIFYPYSMDFFHHSETMKQLALNVLLLQAWSPHVATYWSYNAPSWSLSCEMFFYAVFPVAASFLWRNTFAKLAVVCAAIFCGTVLADKAIPHLDPYWLGSVNPLVSFSAFAIGVASGIWHRRRIIPATSLVRDSALQATALALALGANASFATFHAHITPGADAFLATFAAAPFYAVLILSLARHDGLVSRFLSLRPIVYGGEISFAIYLFHQLFIRWHWSYQAKFNGIPVWEQYAGMMALVFATSIIAHHLVEKPAQRAILAGWRRLLPTTQADRSPVSPARP